MYQLIGGDIVCSFFPLLSRPDYSSSPIYGSPHGKPGLQRLKLGWISSSREFSSCIENIWESLTRKSVNSLGDLSSKSYILNLTRWRKCNFILPNFTRLIKTHGYSRYASQYPKNFTAFIGFSIQRKFPWSLKRKEKISQKGILSVVGGATSRRLERTYLAELRRRIEEASMEWLVPDP